MPNPFVTEPGLSIPCSLFFKLSKRGALLHAYEELHTQWEEGGEDPKQVQEAYNSIIQSLRKALDYEATELPHISWAMNVRHALRPERDLRVGTVLAELRMMLEEGAKNMRPEEAAQLLKKYDPQALEYFQTWGPHAVRQLQRKAEEKP